MRLPAGVSPDDEGRRPSPDATWLRSQRWEAPSPRVPRAAPAPLPPLSPVIVVDEAPEDPARARQRRRLLAVGVAVGALLLAAAAFAPGLVTSQEPGALRGSAPSNATATVLLIRHCDKDDRSTTHCSPRGFRRATWLQTMFDGRYPAPDRLYARKPEGSRRVLRSVETLRPTAARFGLDIDVEYGVDTMKRLASLLRADVARGALTEKLVVVAWKHEQLADFAKALGWPDPPAWKYDDFDSIYRLRFSKETGAWRVAGVHENEGFVDPSDDDDVP